VKNTGRILLLILIAVVLVDVAYGQGCSQCKLVSEQGSELSEDSFGSNINYGILYLMAIPYLAIMFLFRARIYNFFKKLFAR
jgi:hypothetical protein